MDNLLIIALVIGGLVMAAEAELFGVSGRPDESRRRYEEAIATHQQKGDLARAERASRMRDDASAAAREPLI